MLHLENQALSFHPVETSVLEDLHQMALPGPGESGLANTVGSWCFTALQNGLRGSLPAAQIPNARRHRPIRPGDPAHLPNTCDGVGHVMDDQLGQGEIEQVVVEGQALSRGFSHGDARESLPRCRDERRRRVDSRHRLSAEPVDEHAGEGTRPTADLDGRLVAGHTGEVGEDRRQQRRVTTHESVVGVGGNDEAHRHQPTCR